MKPTNVIPIQRGIIIKAKKDMVYFLTKVLGYNLSALQEEMIRLFEKETP